MLILHKNHLIVIYYLINKSLDLLSTRRRKEPEFTEFHC